VRCVRKAGNRALLDDKLKQVSGEPRRHTVEMYTYAAAQKSSWSDLAVSLTSDLEAF